MAERTVAATAIFALPGASTFPESVGVDPVGGDAFVGGLGDGALYRIARATGAVSTFSPPGDGGRSSVAGVKVDAAGRLWAAGGYDGTLDVHRLDDGERLVRLDVGRRPSCVNDLAFGPDGVAYVTDSLVPVLFRVDPDTLTLEGWVDLAEQGVPWEEGLNLNGIVLTPDGRHLLTCQTNLGRYWRVAIATGRVDEVALDGGPLEHSDGLAIAGSTVYAAVNAAQRIAVIEVADDGGSGAVRETLRSGAFAFPTAVAVQEDRLLVVNGQLDRMGAAPELPFTVAAVGLGPG